MSPNGYKVFMQIIPGEKVYPEKICKKYGFAIIFLQNNGIRVKVDFRYANRIWIPAEEDNWSSVHTLHGIFGVYNPNLNTSKFIGKISIIDLAPTILELFGIKKPKNLPGKSIAQLII